MSTQSVGRPHLATHYGLYARALGEMIPTYFFDSSLEHIVWHLCLMSSICENDTLSRVYVQLP